MFFKIGGLGNFAKCTGHTCTGASILIKLQVVPVILLKRRLLLKCFPVNFYEHLFNDTENRSFAVSDLFHMSTKKDLYLKWYEHH